VSSVFSLINTTSKTVVFRILLGCVFYDLLCKLHLSIYLLYAMIRLLDIYVTVLCIYYSVKFILYVNVCDRILALTKPHDGILMTLYKNFIGRLGPIESIMLLPL
jgi:hypothetical protein